MDKVCPFCGAELHDNYLCVSLNHVISGYTCKDRQIAQLQGRLEAWRSHWREDHGYETTWTPSLEKLKSLGEI